MKKNVWRTIKFKGDLAIYAECKCGFYYNCSYSKGLKTFIDPYKLYNYCPSCGSKKKKYTTSPKNLNYIQWERRK